jgi:hypothetical protein
MSAPAQATLPRLEETTAARQPEHTTLRQRIANGPLWLLFVVTAVMLVFSRKAREDLDRYTAI